jgi:3-dehydroquinate synthase/shikimate kinase/3-dehydroquinate synthase
LILNRNFFLWLCKNAKKIINDKNKKITKLAIIQSCKIKSKIVSQDEKEKNLRMILNFGHTFAHGFEAASNFSKKLNHGEAVLLGMITASHLANKIKLLSTNDLSLIKKHYAELKLPMKINKFFKKNKINKIVSFMQKDKKNSNSKISLILIKKIGTVSKPIIISFSKNKIRNFLNNLYK